MASPNLNPSPSWLLPPLPKTQPLPPWLPLGPHLNLTFTSHYSLAHWLVLTSTPPSLGSSPPYLNPTPPSLATSRPSPLLHTYILYPFYCFSPPRAPPNVNHLPPSHTNRAQSLPHLSSLPSPPSLPEVRAGGICLCLLVCACVWGGRRFNIYILRKFQICSTVSLTMLYLRSPALIHFA